MSDIIHLLPDSIANQIAAGEVIQRPASVVKELMENAVDAQADSIELILKDSGKTLIKVNDNGLGMSDTAARLCFERHATSKISSANDLFSIRTSSKDLNVKNNLFVSVKKDLLLPWKIFFSMYRLVEIS